MQRHNRVGTQPEHDRLTVDVEALAPTLGPAAGLGALDQRAQPVATSVVAVSPGRRDSANEGRCQCPRTRGEPNSAYPFSDMSDLGCLCGVTHAPIFRRAVVAAGAKHDSEEVFQRLDDGAKHPATDIPRPSGRLSALHGGAKSRAPTPVSCDTFRAAVFAPQHRSTATSLPSQPENSLSWHAPNPNGVGQASTSRRPTGSQPTTPSPSRPGMGFLFVCLNICKKSATRSRGSRRHRKNQTATGITATNRGPPHPACSTWTPTRSASRSPRHGCRGIEHRGHRYVNIAVAIRPLSPVPSR